MKYEATITAEDIAVLNQRLAQRRRGQHPGPTAEQRACRHPRLRWYADLSGRCCVDCLVDEKDFFRAEPPK